MNEHWPRWVFASMSKHFADHFAAQTPPVPLFVEGDDRDTALLQKFSEFRMDGPRIREQSKGYWEVYVPVNILIQTSMNDKDAHLHRKQMGIAASGFARTISIFKYGNGVDDDQTLLLCMTLMGDKSNPLQVKDFGQVDTTVRLQQATVEGHYKGFITE
jgi:hypothetical protein